VTPAGVLHALGSAFFLAGAAAAFASLRTGSRPAMNAARAAGLLGAVLQVAALVYLGASTGRFPVRGADEAFFLLSAAVVGVALTLDWARGLSIVLAATLPLSVVTAGLGLILFSAAPGSESPGEVSGIWTSVHILITLGSYGAFALAFVAGLLYLITQKQLKGHGLSPALGYMPALETVSRLNTRSIAVGLVLLVAGLVIGYLQARVTYAGEHGWRLDPKIILTTLTIAAYVAVLVLSRRPAFKGRRTALASIAGFFLVMTTFWASIFWSGFHNFR